MILQIKTLEKLRNIINEESEYRSGPQLVAFFNHLGFKDSYGQGFPSRWKYTDDKLSQINGTPELDKCIKNVFAVVNFANKISELDNLILEFNKILTFDKWKIKREHSEIIFQKLDKVIIETESTSKGELKEEEFLNQEFKDLSIDHIGLDGTITDVLNYRFSEIKICLEKDAPLSAIFLIGSTLEGLLLGVALKNIKEFNQANSSPKDKDGKVKQFPMWSLSNFIDVAYELKLLNLDVKKFSHTLRDFRNYIHPFEQMSSNFQPDKHTAKICWQVLKAGIFQLTKNKINSR
ncbi:hypothetical protein [Empedobacter falsenii]|uniref:HEPN domain-containing protein n=1 Tax=Empedobacter falsenii TaxID=343874 RepID=A0AAW7DGU9_9FLAO|nr:hypothetical protein [Empedobacter falsenii]MDM1551186.1 hypothetical protein [Empedobacter falsenii]